MRRGFTLLEVLVAVSILGLGLTTILSSQVGLFSSASHGQNLTRAVGLARCRMNETELDLLKNGFPLTDQTDEGDLMPYPVLDFIERAAIRDRKSPREVLGLLEIAFPAHPAETRRQWTRRFFTLWSRNQWKRERYAPGFHLDDENLDPKTWCRWPILSGGFREELDAL